MKIEQIDKNFSFSSTITKEGKAFYRIPHNCFALYGVFYDEKKGFLRMDYDAAFEISEGVRSLTTFTAGGRLRFKTDSSSLGICVSYASLCKMSHMSLTNMGFSLFEIVDGKETFVGIMPPKFTDEKGYEATLPLKGGKMREYILYFPNYNEVFELSVILDEGARVEKGAPYRELKPILYYGSSITQGGCASRPDNAYESLICRWNHLDFINLGFSGNAKGEPLMAEYLSTIDCSLFVCDYDHNAYDRDGRAQGTLLRETHFKLYEIFRKRQRETPILFISRPDSERDEGGIRRDIIFESYQRAKELGDKNVHFLDGSELFGAEDRISCTVDGCHPNDLGLYRMAKRIYEKLKEIDEIFT